MVRLRFTPFGSRISRFACSWGPRTMSVLCVAPVLMVACDTTEPPEPAELAFAVQPSTVAAGAPIAVQVAVRDDRGNVVTSAKTPVTLELLGSPEVELTGTTTATPVNGIATFSNLSIEKAASYRLVATSGSFSANSASFTVGPAAPAKLVFLSQPTSVEAYRLIGSGFQVAIHDAFGNVVTSIAKDTLGNPVGFNVDVEFALAANPGGATKTGQSHARTTSGIATLRDFRLDAPGTGYTLTVSRAGLTSATSAPFAVTVPPPYTAIAAAAFHACGIISGEGVHCWGQNGFGQIGNGNTSSPSFAVPVIGGTQFTSVSVGYLHSCGLTAAGAGFCWGRNFAGMLGDGTTIHRSAPVAVAGGHAFATIAAGGIHGCGLKADGAAYCWGYNEHGAIGDGTFTNRLTAVPVSGGLQFSALAAGDLHNCGLVAGGAAYCWGSNGGALGDGTIINRPTPTPVAGGLMFSSISPGNAHTCALTAAGTAYCWGANGYSQLGDGTQDDRLAPVPVTGGLSFQSISTGASHTCGLTADGTAYCWGNNHNGKLGDGTTETRSAPTPVASTVKFSVISAGASFSCGISTGGVAYCWGEGMDGQVGNAGFGNSLLPARVVR